MVGVLCWSRMTSQYELVARSCTACSKAQPTLQAGMLSRYIGIDVVETKGPAGHAKKLACCPVRFMADWEAMGSTTCGCEMGGCGALTDIRLRRRLGDLQCVPMHDKGHAVRGRGENHGPTSPCCVHICTACSRADYVALKQTSSAPHKVGVFVPPSWFAKVQKLTSQEAH